MIDPGIITELDRMDTAHALTWLRVSTLAGQGSFSFFFEVKTNASHVSSQGLLLIKLSNLKGPAAPCTQQRRRWSFPGFSHRILLSSMSPFLENTLVNYLHRDTIAAIYMSSE